MLRTTKTLVVTLMLAVTASALAFNFNTFLAGLTETTNGIVVTCPESIRTPADPNEERYCIEFPYEYDIAKTLVNLQFMVDAELSPLDGWKLREDGLYATAAWMVTGERAVIGVFLFTGSTPTRAILSWITGW